MRRVLATPSRRLGLLLLLAVILFGAAGYGVYRQVTAFSYHDFESALRARGATTDEIGPASTITFQGAGHALFVNGVQVAAYEYGTALAAQMDAARVSTDGSTFARGLWPLGGEGLNVDWIAPPHHFKKGRVIVTYIGGDSATIELLSAVLGPQFAGGAIAGGNGYPWLVERLRASGAAVEFVRYRANWPVFVGTEPTTNARDLRVNGTIVSVFEFTSDQTAADYASHISGGDFFDPAGHVGIIVEYAYPPHFYRADRLIVLYVGTDPQVMRLLAAVLGPPFTEEQW